MKKDVLIKVLIYLFVLAWYSIVFLGEEAADHLTDEDNLIESLGAIFFLIAAIFYFASFLQSSGLDQNKTPKIKKNYFYFFLGVLFFLGFGEEISWGQRLVDFETPQILQEFNTHNETNLHNIKVNGTGIRFDYLFFIFWFSYCLILPMVSKYSLATRRHISRFGLPVPPLWIGFLLLTNFLIYTIPMFPIFFPKGFSTHYIYSAFLEIMESNAAFIFAVLGFYELKKQLLIKKGKLMKEQELEEV